MASLVICGAAPFETDPLVAGLTQANIPFTRVVCGIGSVEAAAVASTLRDLVAGRHVVFVGTAGMIGVPADKRVYMAQSVSLAPFDVRSRQTELIENFDPPVVLDTPQWGLPLANVAGSLGVTVAAELGGDFNGQLETMELYSVARLWKPVAKTFTGIFFVTNATGAAARREWKDHFRLAAATTAGVLLPLLVQQFRQENH